MDDEKSEMSYAGRFPCGCILTVCSMRAADAKWFAYQVKHGATVEQVKTEDIRSGAMPFGHTDQCKLDAARRG